MEVNGASNSDAKLNSHFEKDEKVDSDVLNGSAHDEPTNGELVNGVEEEQNGEVQQPDEEVVVIQDAGFTINIQSPGLETFEIPVSSMELIQEIYQVLIDKEETCHRTCFVLQLDGTTLDNFAEVKAIQGLKEGSVVKVVEEPYTIREARIHVRHVRDLLKSIDLIDSYSGADCNSLSLLNIITKGNILEKKAPSKADTIDCTPPEHIMPGSKDRPLVPLHPVQKELKGPQCLKVLTYSGWNPPPSNRRMNGDLLYIYVVTMEDKRYHITSSPQGFYLNQSTLDDFNPKPVQPKHVYHSLVELLNQISPIFKRNFQQLLKKRQQKHPFERVPTPFQTYNWLAPSLDHSFDYIRSEDAFSSRLGYEEHIPGLTRDWNEELQTTRELPRKHLPERLMRERTIFKVHSDFVVAATRGAQLVVDGNIMAINPGEDSKMQMFLWNNIFLSLGFDVKDHFKEFGGDCAAYAAPVCDLQGVKAYTGIDVEGLYTLGTVVVDYRGYRVTAQSIIPGILEREQEQSVVYGSIDFGKTVVTHDKYKELMKKTAESLKIQPHKVVNSKGEEVELYSSVECKGIIGNDGRHYILDLLRTSPADVHFLSVDPSELSSISRENGFPRAHRHKLACLRQELVEAFVESRYLKFVQSAATQFQMMKLKKMQANVAEEKDKAEVPAINGTDGEDAKEVVESQSEEVAVAVGQSIKSEILDESRDVIKNAARLAGSLSDTEFKIAFNTDLFQDHVKHPEDDSETRRREKLLIIDAAAFILTNQIPGFIKDCLEHTSSPIDYFTLSESLHSHGINIRYLGVVAEQLAKHPQLAYLYSIAVSSLVTRASKHLFKTFMQGVDSSSLSSAISHFLNCYLGSFLTPYTQAATEEKGKKKNKKKQKGALPMQGDNVEWSSQTPKSLWKKIIDEVQDYYGFKINSENVDDLVEKFTIQKVSMLRSFCKCVGVQLLLKEYSLDNKNKQAFAAEDVQNVFPVVKHIQPKATDAYHIFTTGQAKIQQGNLQEGYELVSEALNLLNNVYGAMHHEIAACARLLARLSYIMGDYGEALLYQQRAVLMSERVLGIDHPNTITEYAHLALYSFANNQVSTALKLLYRALYLAQLCVGEFHPEVALFYCNIGLILHAVSEFELSLKFLTKALELNSKFFGPKSLKCALNYHLIARTYSCKGDFRSALLSERESYAIYKQILGEGHERTKESSECLKHLTSQAVKFQVTVNQLSKGGKVSLPQLQIQVPSLAVVLETLNLINGIVFVHISPEELEKFREEMVRQQFMQKLSSEAAKKMEDAPKVVNGNTFDALD